MNPGTVIGPTAVKALRKVVAEAGAHGEWKKAALKVADDGLGVPPLLPRPLPASKRLPGKRRGEGWADVEFGSDGELAEMLGAQKADGGASVLGTKHPNGAGSRGSSSSSRPTTGQKAAEARTGKELEGTRSPHLGQDPADKTGGLRGDGKDTKMLGAQKADGGASVFGTKRPNGAGNRGTSSSPTTGHEAAEARTGKEPEGLCSPHLGHHPADETGSLRSGGDLAKAPNLLPPRPPPFIFSFIPACLFD